MTRCVQIDNCMLIEGDCLEIMPDLETPVDAVVTSPPYNLKNRAWIGNSNTRIGRQMGKKYADWYQDDMPEAEYQKWQIHAITEMLKICKGSVFYNHRPRYAWGHNAYKYKTKSRVYHPWDWVSQFPIWCEIIWDKKSGGKPNGRVFQVDERIYQIQRPIVHNYCGYSSVWSISSKPEKENSHVCPFPIEIPERCIEISTHENSIVLDPFMGSGTTGLACLKTHRKFIGIEKDAAYFDLACERIKKAASQLELHLL